MTEFPSLPSLPEWVPYPHVVWFVVEGVVIGLIGLLVRDFLGPAVQALVALGNVLLFVGGASAVLGGLAWVVLVASNR